MGDCDNTAFDVTRSVRAKKPLDSAYHRIGGCRRWTPDEVALLQTLWTDRTLTIIDIAARVGRTWHGIREKAYDLKLPKRRTLYWHQTEGLSERLERLWNEGLSSRVIAERLGNGLTRNAVIGRLHRLGLLGKRPKPTRSIEEIRRRRRETVRRYRSKFNFARPDAAARVKAARVSVTPPDTPLLPFLNIPLAELKEKHCRWPSDEGGSCGQEKWNPKVSSYCAHHHRCAYQPGRG